MFPNIDEKTNGQVLTSTEFFQSAVIFIAIKKIKYSFSFSDCYGSDTTGMNFYQPYQGFEFDTSFNFPNNMCECYYVFVTYLLRNHVYT